jgi:hypothetical protein
MWREKSKGEIEFLTEGSCRIDASEAIVITPNASESQELMVDNFVQLQWSEPNDNHQVHFTWNQSHQEQGPNLSTVRDRVGVHTTRGDSCTFTESDIIVIDLAVSDHQTKTTLNTSAQQNKTAGAAASL